MAKPKTGLPLFGLMALALFLLPNACLALRNKDCGSSLCGNITIKYPVRLKSQPQDCGYHLLELDCDNNNRTTLIIKDGKFYGKFYVKEIFYENFTMQVVNANQGRDDCSLPSSSVYPSYTFGFEAISAREYLRLNVQQNFEFSVMFLVNCTRAVKYSLYIDASRCSNTSSHPPNSYFYFLDEETKPLDFNEFCTIIAQIPVMLGNITGLSTSNIYKKLSMGLELTWKFGYFDNSKLSFHKILGALKYALRTYLDSFVYFLFKGPHVSYDALNPPTSTYVKCLAITGGVILPRMFLGISILISLVTYKLRRRHFSADDTIEKFLRNQNNLMPIRYTYSEVKRMTKGFKDKLGEGGFGSVFKGKLRSNQLVAVKVLGKSKADGQDFISEVATIGRIHHTNVVKLIGFCVEGSKQALVYDFMPNGSLDRIIFSGEGKIALSWQKIYDIALGVARGIEYLHQGCDMQILHFNIKPHNILLDDNFNPKVSDFGLAKLYSVDDSIVSLTAARGTIGYIAPELVYKNIGGISYKADVYSFGMLLMEMIGKRKNLNAFANHACQIYFPSWVYDRIVQGEDIELGEVTDAEKIMVRKMVVVAFWCIQMMPTDRPSMSEVLKMLETDVELVEMPPKPFNQLPLETSSEIHGFEK